MKIKLPLPPMLSILLLLNLSIQAQEILFHEDFNRIADSLNLSDSGSHFNYVVTYSGFARTIKNDGTTALLLQSHTGGHKVTGLGINGLKNSEVTSIAFTLRFNQLPGGTALFLSMGKSGTAIYPDEKAPPRLDGPANNPAWAKDSLFILKIGGNNDLKSGFGLLSLNKEGKAWISLRGKGLAKDTSYKLHLIVNGGKSDIHAGAQKIKKFHVGIYLDGSYLGSLPISANTAADTFRIYTHGRSKSGDFASVIFDDFVIWEGAVNAGATPPVSKKNEISLAVPNPQPPLRRLAYNNPEITSDLGVGLWSWPVPVRKENGLNDLYVVSSYTLGQGTYFFENTGAKDKDGMDVFKAPVLIGKGRHDLTPSYLPDGSVQVLAAGNRYPDFFQSGADKPTPFPVGNRRVHKTNVGIRGAQYSLVDYDGDGKLDLIVGIGDWSEYGWDNAYDKNGRWANGPLHGYIYVLKNSGSNDDPIYGEPERLNAGERPIDLYGMPSPVFGDFLGTGKLDIICGEFVDGLTFFENIGTRKEPKYAPGRRLKTSDGTPITMPLTMIVVRAFDWNNDGRMDLILGQEDGRVALLENTGRTLSFSPPKTTGNNPEPVKIPEFSEPRFFRQQAHEIKVGVLSTPSIVDWDGDGLSDIISGNSAGEILWVRNLGGYPLRWAEPLRLEANGQTIRFMAGYNGSIQGPAECKWGYTNLSTGDWDGDGLPDIIVSDITGRVYWIKNLGDHKPGQAPRLAAPQSIRVWWDGINAPKPAWNWWNPKDDELVVQWRCTPLLITLLGESTPGLVTVDHEGYLALYRQETRNGELRVLPGERIFKTKDGPLRLTTGKAGRSGRRSFTFHDQDGDGRLDLLVNSTNANFKNISTKEGEWLFEDLGPSASRRIPGHNTSPAIGDLHGTGENTLIIGAEDGYFYYLSNDPVSVAP